MLVHRVRTVSPITQPCKVHRHVVYRHFLCSLVEHKAGYMLGVRGITPAWYGDFGLPGKAQNGGGFDWCNAYGLLLSFVNTPYEHKAIF